jgi:hypothetical protein
METIKKTDPFSGEEFIPKKISQKYACAANRIKHNNKKASNIRQERAFLDKHTHKNDLILREIYKDGDINVFNSFWMEGKGFRFDATNHQIEFDGMLRNCVYEFILLEVEETNNIKIIKNGRF